MESGVNGRFAQRINGFAAYYLLIPCHPLTQSRFSAFHAQVVSAAVAWLRPKRVRVYPAALIVGIMAFLAWAEISALSSGLPLAKTLGQAFAVFYTGGRFFLDGRLAELYDFAAQQAFQRSVIVPGGLEGRTFFVNPPFTVLLFAPFAWGGYVTGLILWWGAGLLALTCSAYLLRQELFSSGQPSVARLVWLSFLFYPTLAWLIYGHNTPLTLLLYTLTFILLRRGRDFMAGAALGLLLYKPHLAIALSVMLLVKRRWRALVGGALSAGLWALIGFALSPAAMQAFLRLAPRLPELERTWSYSWGLNSFFGFSALLLDGFWRGGADLLALGLTAGGLIAVVRWWRATAWRPGTRAWDFTLAATMALGLLISPHLVLYDLMLLLVPLAIVWSHYPHGTGERDLDGGPLLAWMAALYVVSLGGSYFSALQQHLSLGWGLPPVAVQVGVPVLAGWAWVVRRLATQAAGRSAPG